MQKFVCSLVALRVFRLAGQLKLGRTMFAAMQIFAADRMDSDERDELIATAANVIVRHA